jgi:hypothetical protein
MSRLTSAWRALDSEQRLAAGVSVGLFVSMFLPWYGKTDTLVVHDTARTTQTSLSAFAAFSFVEAAVLLVSAAVLAMLFARAERRDFQLPGGDGLIVMLAGGWTALLIFYRLLDKPSLKSTERITATEGVEWGIFIALLLAIGLVYAGGRMRAAKHASPKRSREASTDRRPRVSSAEEQRTPRWAPAAPDFPTTAAVPARSPGSAPVPAAPRPAAKRPRYPPAPSEQMSFEDPPTRPQ